MDYELTGAGGRRKATVAARSSAMVLFDKFLLSMDFPCYDDFLAEIKENKRSSKEICNIVLFQKFGTFLVNCMSNKGVFYKSGTLLMYISGVNHCLQEAFPNDAVLKAGSLSGSWMQLLRYAIEKDVTRREIKLGQNVSDNALPIGRIILTDICDALLKVSGQSHHFNLKSIPLFAFLTDHN